MMLFMEFDEKHSINPYMTFEEFLDDHRDHEITLRDDDAIHGPDSLDVSRIDRAIVEYLGIFNDSDHLHFVVTPLTKKNKLKEPIEVLVLAY